MVETFVAAHITGQAGRGSNLRARLAPILAIAERNADKVDQGCFPHEAFTAMKEARLLGMMAPSALGGEDASLKMVLEICYQLGQVCGSTALIFAMHQIQAACLIRHRGQSAWQAAFLRRLAAEQLLLASSTTEGQGGGDKRSSQAALVEAAGRITLERQTSVVSYGAQADAIVTIARRREDGPSFDQVLVVFPKETYELKPERAWDALGMRGTCSEGFTLRAEGEIGMISPEPYAEIHALTMVPYAHLLWSGVWAGISAAALARGRKFLRDVAASGGQAPGASHFVKANASYRSMCSRIRDVLSHYEQVSDAPEGAASLEVQTDLMLLKVEVSELAVDTVLSVTRACGLAAYRNDSPVSTGRYLRDILSAPIMVHNDRILMNLTATAPSAALPTLFA